MRVRQTAGLIVLMCISMLITACAGTGRSGDVVSPQPRTVAADPDSFLAMEVEWGGIIIGAENRSGSSWLEVLAYPLDRYGHPRTELESEGRFQAVYPGYLETVNDAAGRSVTIRGRIKEVRIGRIGKAQYLFPLLEFDSLRLWSGRERSSAPPEVRFSFGLGFGF